MRLIVFRLRLCNTHISYDQDKLIDLISPETNKKGRLILYIYYHHQRVRFNVRVNVIMLNLLINTIVPRKQALFTYAPRRIMTQNAIYAQGRGRVSLTLHCSALASSDS